MQHLVTADELAARLDAGDVIVADVRWYLDGRSGRDAYRSGHIPGAVFVDLDQALAGPPGSSGRHPLPDPDAFAHAMGSVGIGDDDLVVAYDDAGGSVAARLWWMLHVTGHPAAILDGGMPAWKGPVDTGEGTWREVARFTARPWPADAIATADELEGRLLLDARAPERFRGDVEPIDARAGHIPGAINAPWAANLDSTGRFLPPDALLARYRDLGVGAGTDVVCYCGSGVTACHDVLALAIAGVERVRLYPGSWSEWSRDLDRDVSTG